MRDLVVALTTMPDDARADELARAIVDERLAACVNVLAPMTSTYRWKGALEREPERQLVIKTTRDRLTALEARVRQLHPYELPEFLVLTVEAASAAYAEWVTEETRTNGARSASG
jgi:periplasmic divalent cation tolerance protein